jgi:acyl-CoA reductase-like NAD-dependent aldehyde dehydrogenase
VKAIAECRNVLRRAGETDARQKLARTWRRQRTPHATHRRGDDATRGGRATGVRSTSLNATAPTLLDQRRQARVLEEEIFGPLLPILGFRGRSH